MSEKIFDTIKWIIPSLIMTSIFYEIAFFYGMGISITDTPFGASDLLRDWVNWYQVIFWFMAGLLLELIFRRFEKYQSEDELVNKSSNPKLTKKFRSGPYKIFMYVGFFYLLLLIIFGEIFLIRATWGIILLGLLLIKWLSMERLETNSLRLLGLVYLIIAIFSIVGFSAGTKIVDKETNSFIETEQGKVQVLKIYDQWTLVKYDTFEYGWLNHQSDRVIKFTASRKKFDGLISYFCNK